MINYTPSIPNTDTPGFLGWQMKLPDHKAALKAFSDVASTGRMPSPELIEGLIAAICFFEQDETRRDELRVQLLEQANATDIAEALNMISALIPAK